MLAWGSLLEWLWVSGSVRSLSLQVQKPRGTGNNQTSSLVCGAGRLGRALGCTVEQVCPLCPVPAPSAWSTPLGPARWPAPEAPEGGGPVTASPPPPPTPRLDLGTSHVVVGEAGCPESGRLGGCSCSCNCPQGLPPSGRGDDLCSRQPGGGPSAIVGDHLAKCAHLCRALGDPE